MLQISCFSWKKVITITTAIWQRMWRKSNSLKINLKDFYLIFLILHMFEESLKKSEAHFVHIFQISFLYKFVIDYLGIYIILQAFHVCPPPLKPPSIKEKKLNLLLLLPHHTFTYSFMVLVLRAVCHAVYIVQTDFLVNVHCNLLLV